MSLVPPSWLLKPDWPVPQSDQTRSRAPSFFHGGAEIPLRTNWTPFPHPLREYFPKYKQTAVILHLPRLLMPFTFFVGGFPANIQSLLLSPKKTSRLSLGTYFLEISHIPPFFLVEMPRSPHTSLFKVITTPLPLLSPPFSLD